MGEACALWVIWGPVIIWTLYVLFVVAIGVSRFLVRTLYWALGRKSPSFFVPKPLDENDPERLRRLERRYVRALRDRAAPPPTR